MSLDAEIALLLKHRAAEAGKPVSQYLGQLIRDSEVRRRDQLAEEGYHVLSQDNLTFADSARGLAMEVWSDW